MKELKRYNFDPVTEKAIEVEGKDLRDNDFYSAPIWEAEQDGRVFGKIGFNDRLCCYKSNYGEEWLIDPFEAVVGYFSEFDEDFVHLTLRVYLPDLASAKKMVAIHMKIIAKAVKESHYLTTFFGFAEDGNSEKVTMSSANGFLYTSAATKVWVGDLIPECVEYRCDPCGAVPETVYLWADPMFLPTQELNF